MTRNTIYKILSVPAFGFAYVFTTLMVLLGIPFVYLRSKKIVRELMRFWALVLLLIIGKRPVVTGRENINSASHFILVANHTSLFDIVGIISEFPGISWFGHERLLSIPVFRRFLLLTDYVPMRKATFRNTKEMISLLKEKAGKTNIAIFPEGTRTVDGKINDFYRGFILLLRSADVNVLPVTLNGFYTLKPKTRFHIDFSVTLEMIIHKPIERANLINLSDREIAEVVRKRIESAKTPEAFLSDSASIDTNLIKA
jgi:1-acyl-sn-glycerol-3-phosphate acyltransferase